MFNKRNKVNFYNKNLSKAIFDKYIFIESLLGHDIGSELLYAAKNILENYDHKLIIVTENKKSSKARLSYEKYNDRIIFVKPKTYLYSKYLARCKFLLNDTTFKWYFKKRPEQVYFNTWHGVPIKALGRYIRSSQLHSINNVKKNFEFADRVIVNSNYLQKMLKGSYRLNHNATFLNKKFYKYSNILKNKNDSNKRIISFFYTWLEGEFELEKLLDKIMYIDNILYDFPLREKNDEFYISLHHFVYNKRLIRKIKKKLKVIKIMPEDMSSDDLIDISDTIITDYSSVLFDATLKDKKAILDWSNEKEYESIRGIIGEFKENNPFTPYENIKDSIKAIYKPDQVSQNEKELFNKHFLSEEFSNSEYWIDDFINYEKDIKKKKDRDDWILFYPGRLSINGLTSSAISTIETLLSQGKKVSIWIPSFIKDISILSKTGFLKNENVEILLTSAESKNKTFIEKIALTFVKKNWKTPNFLYKVVEKYYEKEKDKIFGNSTFSKAIHFTGYEIMVAEIFKHINAKEKIIYVHNDMVEEYKKRKNFKRKSIYSAYYSFDKIICVSEFLRDLLLNKSKAYKDNESKFLFINNPLSEAIFKINNENDEINKPEKKEGNFEVFKSKLFDQECFKIINVGRFSKEKNQKFLVREYENFRKNNPGINSILILVGSQRKLNKRYHDSLRRRVERSSYAHDIYRFENINVYSLLKHCSLFALPSTHEGFPIATLEAHFSGLDILFTNLPGNIEQKEKYGIGEIFEMNDSIDFQVKLKSFYNNFKKEKTNNSLKGYNQKISKQLQDVYNK